MPKSKYTSQYKYRKTVDGFFTNVYGQHRSRSNQRGYPIPNYTKQQLRDKFEHTNKFIVLWEWWVLCDFEKYLTPSFYRIDSSKPYTLDNLQLMTWSENDRKGRKERSKSVNQYDLEGNYLQSFDSISEAVKITGSHQSAIVECCRGNRRTTNNFKWKYKNI